MQNDKHTSKSFDQDLDEAIRLFLYMGDSAASQVTKAIHALTDKDAVLAQEVIDMDFDINRMEIELDEHILLLVAKRQPTASDLRLVMAISKGVVDLERIGDEAVKMAQMALKIIAQSHTPYGYAEVQHLGNHVRLMLHNALDCFSQSNAEQAFEVIRNDDVVNAEYQSALRALMTYIMEDSRHVSKVINVMWVLRALERIGDHAQNIAELVINYMSGHDVRHSDYTLVEKAVQEANDRMASHYPQVTMSQEESPSTVEDKVKE
ncbi:phosphate signaling complex protein PhoU [Psychrobacter sp. 16-MNA-CIBAN-0192]|uniref:phosphate signaling complex protein PhoU n=1 Tax=Psychrobacter sp. 16-MNA-CIBAN-0192 TaxID=3140448 RepID=UPI0033339530